MQVGWTRQAQHTTGLCGASQRRSSPPFLQSAGRGDLLHWGEKYGSTVIIWESLSEQENAGWLDEASTTHDWVVWCKSKKVVDRIRSSELSGKEIFFKYDKTEKVVDKICSYELSGKEVSEQLPAKLTLAFI